MPDGYPGRPAQERCFLPPRAREWQVKMYGQEAGVFEESERSAGRGG
jgi:hypothetical protein